METVPSNKFRTLLIGTGLGALAGLLAAYLMIQKAEHEHKQPEISAGDGVKLGLGVLGLMRYISDMGVKK